MCIFLLWYNFAQPTACEAPICSSKYTTGGCFAILGVSLKEGIVRLKIIKKGEFLLFSRSNSFKPFPVINQLSFPPHYDTPKDLDTMQQNLKTNVEENSSFQHSLRAEDNPSFDAMTFFNMYYSSGWNDSDVKTSLMTSLPESNETSSIERKNKFGLELQMNDPTLYRYEENSNIDNSYYANNNNNNNNNNNKYNIDDDLGTYYSKEQAEEKMSHEFENDSTNNFNKFFMDNSEDNVEDNVEGNVEDNHGDVPDFLKFAIPMSSQVVVPINRRKVDNVKTSYASAKFS